MKPWLAAVLMTPRWLAAVPSAVLTLLAAPARAALDTHDPADAGIGLAEEYDFLPIDRGNPIDGSFTLDLALLTSGLLNSASARQQRQC
jgi:hypothetical protein